MDDHDETLSMRLRAAALQRTRHQSERVDDFVLDADGVIDLRRLDDPDDARSVATPPAALRVTRGRLGDAGDVGHLYDESEPQTGWFRRRRNRRPRPDPTSGSIAAATPADDAGEGGADEPATDDALDLTSLVLTWSTRPDPPVTRLTSEEGLDPDPTSGSTARAVDPAPPTPEADAGIDVDLRDDNRPTATCPKCGATGQRDLFDRVSQTSYYSCDACTHMWQQAEPA